MKVLIFVISQFLLIILICLFWMGSTLPTFRTSLCPMTKYRFSNHSYFPLEFQVKRREEFHRMLYASYCLNVLTNQNHIIYKHLHALQYSKASNLDGLPLHHGAHQLQYTLASWCWLPSLKVVASYVLIGEIVALPLPLTG